jgi:hypothetical protein
MVQNIYKGRGDEKCGSIVAERKSVYIKERERE